MRPGVTKRIDQYNKILADELKDNLISIQKFINDVNGFNSDNIHLNKSGHKVVSEVLLNKMIAYLNSN